MTSLGNRLRTSKVNINRIHFIFNHFGSLDHSLRVVSAELSHEWSILGAGSKMLCFIFLLSGHHFRMQHRCITEIGSVLAGQYSKWQFGLIYHGRADHEGEVKG